jgi:hypothetical protein
MKDQYFGDINDYKKFGLLRSIISASEIKILIAWMLTKDDGSTDGKFIEYLSKPEKWLKYDEALYLEIANLLEKNKKREVSLIERTDLLGGSEFYSKFVPDNSEHRENWLSELINGAKNSDLIFLDPDNGLEIKSKKYGTKNSSKFLYWHEVEELWKKGKSLLIYQHFIREKRELFIERMLNSLSHNTPSSIVEAFSTSNVVFLLALQPEHHNFHQSIINSVESKWLGEIQCKSTINN